MEEQILKKCSKCGKEKPLSDFYEFSQCRGGVRPECKKCHSLLAKEWREKNKEHKNKKDKEYRENNKEKIQKRHRQYYLEHREEIKNNNFLNKEKIKLKTREYYLKHKDKKREYSRQYRLNHPEKIKKDLINYRATHKKEIQKQVNIYTFNKRNTDIEFKIKGNLRNRIRLVLKRNTKSGHTLELLGCSVDFLKKHLESQFTDGMTWDNYGLKGWHIDHIKPCCSFDLSKPEEQKTCFHYSNLQPLWWYDNLDKRLTDTTYKNRI